MVDASPARASSVAASLAGTPKLPAANSDVDKPAAPGAAPYAGTPTTRGAEGENGPEAADPAQALTRKENTGVACLRGAPVAGSGCGRRAQDCVFHIRMIYMFTNA